MDFKGSDTIPGPRTEDHLPHTAQAAVKIVIVGGFGVGKTTMVGSVSEIRPLTTEETMTQAGVGVDDNYGSDTKTATTVAMDFGRISKDELEWRQSISSRHLVELPVRFAPKPPQDVTQKPGHAPVPSQRTDWQIGTPQPGPATPAPAAEPQPPAPPQPVPTPEPVRPQGAWRRFLRWWRGY